MGIGCAIFHGLESFGKERIFKMAMECFWIFVWKNFLNILKLMYLSVTLNTVYVMLFIILFIIQNIIHQKIMKCVIENGVFLLLWGFLNANENELHCFGNLVISLWKKFGKVLEIFLRSLYEL